jgi:tryptophan synthase alpha chain
MPNRIDQKFADLKAQGRKGFIAYIAAGDPSLAATKSLAIAFEKIGVDVLELGVPFSDPLADGIVNQLASQRALEGGATVHRVLDTVREIRRESQIPIVLYTYVNPIYKYGLAQFFTDAKTAGVDGLLILDLPPEEDCAEFADASGLKHIRLIAPTTPPARIREITAKADGFIYYVSREGVTGEQASVAESLAERVAEIRKTTALPIAVGFGVSNPDHVREIALSADAVVVGSAIVKRIAEHGQSPDLVERVSAFVQPLVDALR